MSLDEAWDSRRSRIPFGRSFRLWIRSLSARPRGWSWICVAIRRPLDEIQFTLMVVMVFFLDPFRNSSGVDLQHVELVLQVVHLGGNFVASSLVGLELVVTRSHHGRSLVSQDALSPLSSRFDNDVATWHGF